MNQSKNTKRRKRRNSSTGDNPNKVERWARRWFDKVSAVFCSSPILILPFAVLTFIISVDFSALINGGLTERDTIQYLRSVESDVLIEDGEIIKGTILPLVYAITILVALFNLRSLLLFASKSFHIVIMLAVILLGTIYSDEPVKVVTNAITIYVGMIAAILASIPYLKNQNFSALFFAMLLPMAAIHVISEYALFASATNPLDILESKNRFRGITYNPNSLALSSLLGLWGAGALIITKSINPIVKLVCMLLFGLFILNILLAESATALTIALVGFMFGVYMIVIKKVKVRYRIILNLASIFAALSAAIFITVASSTDQLLTSFTGSLGKDSSLTGRTELWAMAFDAIKTKPYLGWGFDSHISVKAEPIYDMRFNHYHNGYMDTLIAGGPILLGILLFNFANHGKNLILANQAHKSAFLLAIPLIMVLLYNLSEYSIMRPNSAMWLLYIACFASAMFAAKINYFNAEKSTHERSKRDQSKDTRYKFG